MDYEEMLTLLDSDSRAFDAVMELRIYEKRTAVLKEILSEVFDALEKGEDTTEATENFAESLLKDDPIVEFTPFQRPVTMLHYVSHIIIGNLELPKSPTQNRLISDFFDSTGERILQEAKVKILQSLEEWKAGK